MGVDQILQIKNKIIEGEVSRCLEIEKYEWQKEADENVLIVHSAVTPENIGLGNIFKITAKWKITPCNSSECRIVVIGEVECTKRMWGLQNIAEGYLYNLVRLFLLMKFLFLIFIFLD